MEIAAEFGKLALGVASGWAAISLGVVTFREAVHYYETPKKQRPKHFAGLNAPKNLYGRKLRY